MKKTKQFIFSLTIITTAFISNPISASVISITGDSTTASASVTYDPGAASDPGTNINSFMGSLFNSGGFVGYDITTTRDATVISSEGFADTTNYIAANTFREVLGEYIGGISLGTGALSQLGTTGLTEASIDTTLRFTVSGGNVDMLLWSELLTSPLYGTSTLSLFDETAATLVVDLAASAYSYDSTMYSLLDTHTYTLAGYAYAYTPNSGDPYSKFGFSFNGATVRSVPEANSLWLISVALVSFLITFRKSRNSLLRC